MYRYSVVAAALARRCKCNITVNARISWEWTTFFAWSQWDAISGNWLVIEAFMSHFILCRRQVTIVATVFDVFCLEAIIYHIGFVSYIGLGFVIVLLKCWNLGPSLTPFTA